MKTYTFYDDSWFDSPVCDCCDGSWMSSFNSAQVSCNFGSASSEEDCYLQAIATELGYQYWEDVPDEYRELGYADLKFLAENTGVKVGFVS